ncbi:MAG: selenocysteine-specific translation elongation factor [Anaerolineaceae bacterium]|nr:selenocysteine-specific translation elongation factor [Anaerolineaceae bacterium]
MYVVGTAGHVDHGKSTLIKALTGIHPDRLKEEQLREMTIDLGFAWLTLPNGEELGIVDVPGHRDFIENMLAGVGGIDAALFVIAADEGVMPQTKEHLAILDLLQVKNGIIVLTKVDLIDDPDWLDLVELDVRDSVAGTILADAPLVRVSSHSKEGMNQLILTIQDLLSTVNPKPDFGRARLPIDRVFSITGFGTIITGTLMDGSLQIGQEVELLPEGIKVRIRGLQTHKKKEVVASPGSRTAVNLSGIDASLVHRGQVLASVHKYQPTKRFDAYLQMLISSTFSLKHNTQIKLFIGSSEVLSRIRVLGKEEILPGENGWVQIEPVTPIVGIRGDRFIIRIPSPGETIGGGLIVNPAPQRRHKRFSEEIIKKLEAYLQGTPDEIFLQAVQDAGIGTFEDLSKKAKLEKSTILNFYSDLINQEKIYQLDKGEVEAKSNLLVCSSHWLNDKKTKSITILDNYHNQYNLRLGIPKEELKSKLKLDPNVFVAVLEVFQSQKIVDAVGNSIRLKEFIPSLSKNQKSQQESLIKSFEESPYATPSVKDCITTFGEELVNYLFAEKFLVSVSNDVAFLNEHYLEMQNWVISKIDSTGSLTAAEFRDKFQTSRKYALAFLEHLDSKGLTLREGDIRRLRKTSR